MSCLPARLHSQCHGFEMKPAPFLYEAPETVAEAARLHADYEGEGRILAGGQSLIAMLNFRIARPVVLIDLGKCRALDYIRVDGGQLLIGAMTRQSTAEHSPIVRRACPLMANALPFVGHSVIRNRGTIGGTLAHADRIAELPAVALALDAEFIVENSNGRRSIAAHDFFVDDLTTSLEPTEILCELRVPVAAEGSATAFVEVGNRHHDLALVGVAVSIRIDAAKRCSEARIAVMGATSIPIRLVSVESELAGRVLSERTVADASRAFASDIVPEDDANASSSYRSRILEGLLQRAIHQALREKRR